MRQWLYHESEQPRISHIGDALEEGWSDHPPIKTTDCGVEPDDVFAVQALGETVEGIKEHLNGLLNLREMRPGQLKAFASKHYGKTIKGRKPILIAQIEAFNCDNSERLH